MRDLARFSRRNWREKYEEEMKAKAASNNVRPDDTQGGMLKYGHVTVSNINCMRVVIDKDRESKWIVCNDIDDYVRYEQHRLNIVAQVTAQDMKAEKQYYGNVIVLDSMYVKTSS